jgi:dTDP-4-amino-4,6-dideoxygalactose transaminase
MSLAPSLALLGGEPAFSRDLHVGRPNLGDKAAVVQRIAQVLDSGWLTNDGPAVREFESQVADRLGVRHCIAMCNGTVALEIAIRAMDLTGEVIVPSFTFVATAHALQWQEITPVFCDVDPSTHMLDPDRVEELITPRTTGILGVHLWGRSAPVDRLSEIAERRGLALLYDAAHAFDCSFGDMPVGNFGACEVFSFHATKFFNTFEGGAVCTNDDTLAERIRLMRNFGFTGVDDVIYIGTNGKMNEVCAAMGLVGLRSIDEFVETNRQHFSHYRDRLQNVPGLRLIEPDEFGRSNFQYVVAEVGPDCLLTRDELVAVLWAERVLARRYFTPGVHRMEPYRSFFPNAGLLLPVTERLAESVMVLPTGTGVDSSDVDTVAGIIESACSRPGAVREALEKQRSAN